MKDRRDHASRPGHRSLPLVPLKSGLFEVALALAEEGRPSQIDSGDPYVSRLEAEVRSATGVVLRRGALILPDVEGYRTTAADSLIRSHDDINAEWRQRRDEMERLARDCGGPAVLLPAAAQDRLPALVATSKGVYAIPCPYSGKALVLCRDADRLRGLPSPSASFEAFLTSDSFGSEDSEAPLFVAAEEPTPEQAEAGVLGLVELRRRMAKTGFEAEGRLPDPSEPWHVLSDRPLPFMLLEAGGDTFDTVADHLGGRGESDDEEGVKRLLFGLQGAGLDAIEIFTLKLILFRQVLEIVSDFHRNFERPHLDLHPGQFSVDLDGARGLGLPSLWSFRAAPFASSSARSRQLAPGIHWVAPPARPRPPYTSPAVQRACLGRPHAGSLLVERLVGHQGQYRVEARLADPNGIFPPPGSDDWIRVRLRHQAIGQVRELLLRRDPRSFGESGSLSAASQLFELDAGTAERWQSLSRVEMGEVEYRVFARLGFDQDLHALGVLLLRLLLVDDQQDLGTVMASFEDDLYKARRQWAESQRKEAEELEHLAAEIIADHPHVFAPQHAFFNRHERREQRPNAIPKGLWEPALIISLGWLISTATEEDGGEPAGPDVLDTARRRYDALLRKCRTLLFRLQPVHLEVHSVIAEMLTSLD